MSAEANAPSITIIKKKKVVGGDGHHGGAWKVAYADFVTAMMAFFLLMWLLGATTEKQRKAIADYFNPTITINRNSGGAGNFFGGENTLSEQSLPNNGLTSLKTPPLEGMQAPGKGGSDNEAVAEKGEDEEFKLIEQTLIGQGGESFVPDDVLRHVITRLSDEGLVIELFDVEGSPLFDGDTAEPNQVLRELTTILADMVRPVTNQVAISGHTRSYALALREDPSWDLSIRRARQVQNLLEAGQLKAERIERVAGYANRRTVSPNPMAQNNNRIEIVLLRSDQEGS